MLLPQTVIEVKNKIELVRQERMKFLMSRLELLPDAPIQMKFCSKSLKMEKNIS